MSRKLRRQQGRKGGPGSVTTEEGTITVRGGVNPAGQAFVQLEWDDQGGQFPPNVARQLGLHFLEAAAAAEQDAAVFNFAHEGIGLPVSEAARFVQGVRDAAHRVHPEPPDGEGHAEVRAAEHQALQRSYDPPAR